MGNNNDTGFNGGKGNRSVQNPTIDELLEKALEQSEKITELTLSIESLLDEYNKY